MRDEILALVEERSYTLKELSALLGVNWFSLRDQVGYLQAERKVTTSRRGREVLVSLRTPELTRIANVSVVTNPRGRFKVARQEAAQQLDRLLGIRESNTGVAVCAAAGCGKRFTPDRQAERFCSETCRTIGVPTNVRTVVVDGVQYEALSVGSQSVTGDWEMGSPLADLGMKVHQP